MARKSRAIAPQMRQISVAVLMAFVGSNAAWAADTKELSEVAVTATKSEHDVRTAPASISVISQEELRVKNAGDVLEAVRGTPGVTLMGRSVGGRKTLSMRGMEGRHVLMLIDGRRISATDDVVGHSDYQYGWVPMEAVQQVEVLRGASSSLYGSEALGGVVNLVTRKPGKVWEGSASISAGSTSSGEKGGQNRGAFYAGGQVTDMLSLRLSGETGSADPVTKKEDRRYSELEGRKAAIGGMVSTLKLTPQQELEADYRGGKEERHYDTVSSAKKAYRSTYDIDRSQSGLTWRGKFDSWRGELRSYQSEIDIKNKTTNGVAITRPQKMADKVIDGYAVINMGVHLLTVGGERRVETLENAGLKGGKDDASHEAVYTQGEFVLQPGLSFVTGVRQDHHEYFGDESSPKAYLVWEPSPGWVVKGGYAHSFKAPTLKQISPSYVGAEGPHTFMGNANVKPESADSTELTIDWKRDGFNSYATVYQTDVDNLITYQLLSVNGTRRTYQYDNVNKARIRGTELGMNWQIVPAWSVGVNATILDTEDKTTGNKLMNRPDHVLGARLDWQGGAGWSSRLSAEHFGKTLVATNTEVPAYNLVNVSLGKQLNKTFSIRAGINNLADIRLYEKSPNYSYAERGRTLFATLRADF